MAEITVDQVYENRYALCVDGFGIVFVDLGERVANVRVYDGFDIAADLDVSLTKDRREVSR